MRYDDLDADPGRRVRDRVYGDVRRDTNRGGRVALASSLMALGSFLLLWSLSAYQVTEPGRASVIIERGVASVTDIDWYLPEVLPELREQAQANPTAVYQLPGYPLPVAVTGQELVESSDAEIRATVLRRSSALVYANGLDAFEMQDDQSFPLLSAENAVDTFVSLLTGNFHTQAGFAAGVFVAIIVIAAAIAAASDRRPGVLRTIGGAALAGSLAGFALSVALVMLAGRSGGDDAFTSEMAAIVEAIAEVPRRNFFIASVFSGIAFLAGIGLSVIERRYFHDRAAEPIPGDWYDDRDRRDLAYGDNSSDTQTRSYQPHDYDDGYDDIPSDDDDIEIGGGESEVGPGKQRR
jgi:hypothetical protein